MADPALDLNTLLIHDRALIHPMQHPSSHENPLIVKSGQGVWITTVDGKRYLDAGSGLWNVNVGYGRDELADAAHAQMRTVAYANNYSGTSNMPAIELAHYLAGYAYEGLNTTFFTSGGTEANESAFKTARYYWKMLGKPEKFKVISRKDSFHGLSLATMSATGISRLWPMFEPRTPGFLHGASPNPYRYTEPLKSGETIGQSAANSIERIILQEGANTVAAVIAEPVQGAGGVIVPPDDYFPELRRICDQHNVLLIADEVITGFGRTGANFALHRWNVTPDILSFAKGVTSGYLPLGGIQISDAIRESIEDADLEQAWLHGFTCSGHPASCAVALENISIIEREKLVENAESMGNYLLDGFEVLKTKFESVDYARGLGLMCALDFVKSRRNRDPDAELAAEVKRHFQKLGVLARNVGSSLVFSPPLVISKSEIKHLIKMLEQSIEGALKLVKR